MEESNRPTNSSNKRLVSILTIVVLLILIIGLTFSLIFIRHQTRKIETNIKDLDLVLNDLNNELDSQQNIIDDINIQIEKNKDVDTLILEMKNQYPVMAKQLEELIDKNKTDAKIAYLTFDDGPYVKTNQFLDILDKYDVRATFFTLEKSEDTGWSEEDLENVDNVYKRIINEGHTLGNHTSSHKLKSGGIYSSEKAFMDSVNKHTEFTKEKYNYASYIVRFPGGSSQAKSLKSNLIKKLTEAGYGYVDWNSQTGDGSSKTEVGVRQSIANVVETTQNRKFLVVLMHDYSDTTLSALPGIIEGLKDQGYILLPLFYESKMVNKN